MLPKRRSPLSKAWIRPSSRPWPTTPPTTRPSRNRPPDLRRSRKLHHPSDNPMSLDDVRKKIDAVDSEMIRLLNERADLVHEVGEIKKTAGQPIYAPEREEQVLRSLAAKA